MPLINILARKGYGGGYVIMGGGRSFDAEAVLAWPDAETAVMAAGSAVDLVHRRELAAADDPTALRDRFIAEYRARVHALRGAEGMGIDLILRPEQTRAWLEGLIETLPTRRAMPTLTPRRHPVLPL